MFFFGKFNDILIIINCILILPALPEKKLNQEKTERRATEKKLRSKLDEMTLRLKDLEIQMKTDRQNDENEKTTLQQEKEKFRTAALRQAQPVRPL